MGITCKVTLTTHQSWTSATCVVRVALSYGNTAKIQGAQKGQVFRQLPSHNKPLWTHPCGAVADAEKDVFHFLGIETTYTLRPCKGKRRFQTRTVCDTLRQLSTAPQYCMCGLTGTTNKKDVRCTGRMAPEGFWHLSKNPQLEQGLCNSRILGTIRAVLQAALGHISPYRPERGFKGLTNEIIEPPPAPVRNWKGRKLPGASLDPSERLYLHQLLALRMLSSLAS